LNKKDEYSLIYSRKRNTILYRNFVSRTLLLMHLSPFYSLEKDYSALNNKNQFFLLGKMNKKNQFVFHTMKKDFTEMSRTLKPFTNTLLTLKLKNNIIKKEVLILTKLEKNQCI